jgi:hypothetical protein
MPCTVSQITSSVIAAARVLEVLPLLAYQIAGQIAKATHVLQSHETGGRKGNSHQTSQNGGASCASFAIIYQMDSTADGSHAMKLLTMRGKTLSINIGKR